MECSSPIERDRVIKGTRYKYKHRCGQCMGCRITIKQEKTLRILLESMTYPNNIFVTLTYNDEHLPHDLSVSKEHLRNFIKRLRRYSGKKFKYFAVAEYGDKEKRPHYHLIIFGWCALLQYNVDMIQKAWTLKKQPIGFIQVDNMEVGAAAYVSGYITKKLTTEKAINETELKGRTPEFTSQSGGIGKSFVKHLINNMVTRNLNFIGEDYKYLRIHGMVLPLDNYMQKQVNKQLGYEPLPKPNSYHLVVSMEEYFNMNFPEAEQHRREVAEKKARIKIKLSKMRKSL